MTTKVALPEAHVEEIKAAPVDAEVYLPRGEIDEDFAGQEYSVTVRADGLYDIRGYRWEQLGVEIVPYAPL